jgi:hypothetical protein
LKDLEQAKAILAEGNYTCVLCKDQHIHSSTHRGVRPLLELLDTDVSGFSAADKVVGKATALLYCLLKVKAVYAQVISQAALQVLQSQGITVAWDHQVDYIRNRAGDGRCPMEEATEGIDGPKEALAAIENKLKQLQNGS